MRFIRPVDVPQHARRELLLELSGSVTPESLGVSREVLVGMKNGLVEVPDKVLVRLLDLADDDALARVPFFLPYIGYEKVKSLDIQEIMELLVGWARLHPVSANVLLNTLKIELEKLGLSGKAILVTSGSVREFEEYLQARVASGDLAKKTANDRIRYLKLALRELDYILTKRGLRRLIRKYQARKPGVADHLYKALKLFVKEVIQDKELADSIPRPRIEWSSPKAPSWEDICVLVDSLPYASPQRMLLLMAASTGIRIQTLYDLKLESVRGRTIWLWRIRHSKRVYFSFITRKLSVELEGYLKYREDYLSALGRRSMKLFPYKPKRLRMELYSAMDKVLGYRFQLKQLRKRFAEHMSHHLSTLELQVIMGHASREVVEKHYLLRDQIEDLQRKYDDAMGEVKCL